MKRLAAMGLAMAACWAAGCAAGQAHLENPARLGGGAPARAAEAAREVLRDLRFEPIVPPPEPGRIATRPMTSASWFEAWRQDTPTADARWEASFHTIRRRVDVNVAEADGGAEVAVTVTKERLALAGAGPGQAATAFSLYGSSSRDMERPDPVAAERLPWVDEGRDPELEQVILQRVRARLP